MPPIRTVIPVIAAVGLMTAIVAPGAVLYGDNGNALNATTGKPMATVGDYVGAEVAVGGGRLAIADGHRVIDLYGLPGE